MVSQKLLLELKQILKEDYGVELKLEEVLDVVFTVFFVGIDVMSPFVQAP